MNLRRLSGRATAAAATTALAAGALVGLGSTAAHAAEGSNTYSCTVPTLPAQDFLLEVSGTLPPTAPAGATIPAGFLTVNATAAVPESLAGTLALFNIDNAVAEDFAFSIGGAGSAGFPLAGPFEEGDGGTAWNATGTNAAFTTPTPGTYDITMPESFTLSARSGENEVAPLPCTLAEGEEAAKVAEIELTQQSSTTTVKRKVIKVKKGVAAKVPVVVAAEMGTPKGKVVAKKGKKTLGSATLKGGKAVIKLRKLPVGKHKVTVKYAGNASIKGSSAKVVVKVTR